MKALLKLNAQGSQMQLLHIQSNKPTSVKQICKLNDVGRLVDELTEHVFLKPR